MTVRRLLIASCALGAFLLPAAALPQTASAPPPATAPFPPAVPRPGEDSYPGVISLDIDASDVERRIVSITETIPVAAAGPLTLLYPQWLPGNHAPRGPIDKFAGVSFTVAGEPLPWRRDPVNVYAFHIDVPEGAKTVEVRAQYLSSTLRAQGRIEVTREMANLQWNSMLLYPAGYPARGIRIKPSIKLPEGWSFASALTPQSGKAGAAPVAFAETDLETLVDSPMFAGAHFRRYDLDPGGKPSVHLNVVADSEDLIVPTDAQLKLHRNLVEQADRLFGARHYKHYDFLLALSDELGGIGLEHHQSSENAPGAKYFTDQKNVPGDWDLLPHEYTHSWNGKFRRGADLYTDNYDVPMRDSLLWVYEGMTQYWGQILAARSGMWSRDTALAALALTAATYENRVGRAWRPLVDTTNDPIILARRPQAWRSWQRGEDYYSEGLLIWLDADTLIRERTGGRKSLDDFARAFFGVADGRVTPLTYTVEDVVAGLNAVAPYDWAAFLKERVEESGRAAPLDGFERGGWRLVYGDEENPYLSLIEKENKTASFSYSLGFSVNKEDALSDVVWDGPAFNAALKIGDKLIAVDGEAYTAERLKKAILAAKGRKEPISVIVRSGDQIRTVEFDYRDGLRIPRLERIKSAPDRLGQILAAK
ncbi:MAG: peptidase M61 [Pseudomonadota bacterium]|nr:peptidase M61 [Pseudomonadota bacterium]